LKPLYALAAGTALLTACAAFGPEPCTRNWFEWTADRMQDDFQRRNRGPVRRLQTLRQDIDRQPDVFTALAIASVGKDVKLVVADFRERVVPEARAVARQCGIDEGASIILDAFLAEQGLDTQLLRTLGLYDAIVTDPAIATAIAPR
jgi:hypothetical protein